MSIYINQDTLSFHLSAKQCHLEYQAAIQGHIHSTGAQNIYDQSQQAESVIYLLKSLNQEVQLACQGFVSSALLI